MRRTSSICESKIYDATGRGMKYEVVCNCDQCCSVSVVYDQNYKLKKTFQTSPTLREPHGKFSPPHEWKFAACGGFGLHQPELYNRQTDSMIEEKACFLLVSVARPSVSLSTTGGGSERVEEQGKKRSWGQTRERKEK